MRVIPAPRPRPRPPRPAAPAARQIPARAPAVLIPGRRRPRLLRRPPEHQPLQHRHLRAQPLKLGLPERVTLPQPGILLPKPRILRRQTLRQPRQPLIRLQRRRQHILQRRVSIRLRDHASPGNHGAQQTRPAGAHDQRGHGEPGREVRDVDVGDFADEPPRVARGGRALLKLVETAPLLLGGLGQEAGDEDLPVGRIRTPPARADDLDVGLGERECLTRDRHRPVSSCSPFFLQACGLPSRHIGACGS